MKHPKLRWEADGLWPGNHNSVSGDCGFFATSDRAAKCVHIQACPPSGINHRSDPGLTPADPGLTPV